MTIDSVSKLPKPAHFLTPAQRRAARERIEAQGQARAELKADLEEREERARTRARRANAAELVPATPEARSEAAAAAAELEVVLEARRKFEQDGREIEHAHRTALKALDGADRSGNAAVVAYVRERLPDLRAEVHELAVLFAVFEAAKGRPCSAAEALRLQVDEPLVRANVGARRARLLEEIAAEETAEEDANDGG
jgi:hypothetical protein